LRMVELGLGVGVLPVDSHWPAVGESLVSRPLAPEATLTTLLVHRRNRSLRPNAAAAWAQFAEQGGALTSSSSVEANREANPEANTSPASHTVS
ncbi:LysR substrate-binding domain-containing protein, partial [Paraburkholderia sp. SIMBA_054]|uniref:LysR substrate-binding domain-containing protein n=1 Tax=Paraburkholderia sp. SIMBA_054 TaxID=3085795 RepID=UPI003978609E